MIDMGGGTICERERRRVRDTQERERCVRVRVSVCVCACVCGREGSDICARECHLQIIRDKYIQVPYDK